MDATRFVAAATGYTGSQLAASSSGEPSVKAANGTSLSGLLVAVAKYIAAAGSKGASLKAASPEVKQWL